MCGISGFSYCDESLISKMTSSLSWRGKDSTGYYLSDNISLGHNRLSIIDHSSNANQPMFSDCSRYIIVYNGEIYNFHTLKEKYLYSQKFKTHSETEVILKLFLLFGEDSFSLLSGMFAIAIWDSYYSKLYLARDRSGIKPLFYSIVNSTLYFSSSPKNIADNINSKRLSINSLNSYIRFGYALGDETLYHGIDYFPAGKYAVFENKILSFYDFCEYKIENNFASVLELNDVEINKQLTADCNVGVFLSGGIDSSIIAYHASQKIDHLNTFSVGFSGNNINNKFNHDLNNAKMFSKFINSNHHEVVINTNELIELFILSCESMTLPISNPTALPLYKLSHYASHASKVILSGDGNDELFCGYDRYRKLNNRSFLLNNLLIKKIIKLRHNNNKIDKIFDSFYRFHSNKDNTIIHTLKGEWFGEKYIANIINSNLNDYSDKSSLDYLIRLDSKFWLQNFSLLLSDNITMRNNIELRVPFLSDELIHFSNSLSLKLKLNSNFGKILHRNSYKNLLPDYIFMTKKGFMSPASDWIRDDKFKLWLMDLILRPNYIFESLFDKNVILKIYDDHIAKRKYNLNLLWSIFVLKYWLDSNNFSDISLYE